MRLWNYIAAAILFILCLGMDSKAADEEKAAQLSIPLRYVAKDGSVKESKLDVSGGAGLTLTASEDAAGVVAGCPTGKNGVIEFGKECPVSLEAKHIYRVTGEMRRSPRASVSLSLLGKDGAERRVMPHWDYIVAPAWEPVAGFIIISRDAGFFSFRLNVGNPANGLPMAEMGLRRMEIRDGGPLVSLKPPRKVSTWDKVELSSTLVDLPRFPGSGAGVYRISADVEADDTVNIQLMLAQGDDAILHWHRSSQYEVTVEAKKGRSKLEWVYEVTDRRFIHQWIRGICDGKDKKAVLNNLLLEELMAEPTSTSELGLQTPKYR